MPTHPWVNRALVLLALTAPLGMLALGPKPTPPPPPKEMDLERVYTLLPERSNYERLGQWCGLRRTTATDAEVAQIRQRLAGLADPREAWCGPVGRILWEFPHPSEWRHARMPAMWIRLHHPSDPSRWVGIGVLEVYYTGWTAHCVTYRAQIEF